MNKSKVIQAKFGENWENRTKEKFISLFNSSAAIVDDPNKTFDRISEKYYRQITYEEVGFYLFSNKIVRVIREATKVKFLIKLSHSADGARIIYKQFSSSLWRSGFSFKDTDTYFIDSLDEIF